MAFSCKKKVRCGGGGRRDAQDSHAGADHLKKSTPFHSASNKQRGILALDRN